VVSAALGSGRSSIPGLIHDRGDAALLSVRHTRRTVEQVLRVDPLSGRGRGYRHRLQTGLRVVRQQHDAGTGRHMPRQPSRADIDQLTGGRLIQIPQQRADTGPAGRCILPHRSYPATTTELPARVLHSVGSEAVPRPPTTACHRVVRLDGRARRLRLVLAVPPRDHRRAWPGHVAGTDVGPEQAEAVRSVEHPDADDRSNYQGETELAASCHISM
jgi:hypothetical protein